MTNTNKDPSMFGTVDKLCKDFEELDATVEDHTLQLRIQAEQIKQLQDNGIRLENVIMNENRETRLTVTQSNTQLHELINGIMGFKSGQNQMTHTLKMARMESIAKIVGILAGSGGVLYWIFGGQ